MSDPPARDYSESVREQAAWQASETDVDGHRDLCDKQKVCRKSATLRFL
jgi:hypothetical protein